MAIQLNSGFEVTVAEPLDTRTVVADLTARNNIPPGIRYEGMEVYVTSEQTKYILKGGVTNSDWSESGSGSGGSGAGGINIFGPQTADDYPDVAASGWVAYQDAAGPAPVDGTGGSGSLNLTLTKVTPLGGGIIGASDFRIHKEGGFGTNVQGLGFSKVLSVPPICRGKINEFEEYVHILAANQPYPPGGFSVWAYDVTNGALLGKLYDMPDAPVATVFKLSGKIGIPQTCEQIRIIRHTGASWTLEFTYLFNQMFFGLRTVSEAELGEVDDYPATNSKVLKEIQNSGNLNRILNGTFEGTSPSLGWFTAKNNTPGPVPTFSDRTDGDIAIAFETSAPLYGTRSLKLSRDASNLQGNFLWALITMNRGDEGKILQAKFDYKISGTYAGDIKCFAANSATGELLSAVQGETIENTLLPAQHVFKFQAPATYTPTLVLMLFVSGTGANEADLLVDRVVVGDQEPISRGSPDVYLGELTTTGSWTSNVTYAGNYWRKGDTLRGVVKITLSGAPNSVALDLHIPNGLKVDLTKNPEQQVTSGYGEARDSSLNTAWPAAPLRFGTDTSFRLVSVGADNSNHYRSISQSSPFTFASGDTITITYEVPILGWSSNTVMSNEVGVAKLRAQSIYSGSQSLTANTTNIGFGTPTVNDANTFDGTTYTCDTDQDIEVSMRTVIAAAGDVQVYVDGSLYSEFGYTNYIGQVWGGTFKVFGLKAGNKVTFRFTASGTLTLAQIQISKINYGWQQIAAVEKVLARYRQTSSVGTSTTQPINYSVKDFDTHGAVTTGSAWAFTAPRDGYYRVSTSTQTTTDGAYLRLYFDSGSGYNPYAIMGASQSAASRPFQGSTVIYLKAGHKLQLRGASAWSTSASSDGVYVDIESVDGI